MNSEFVTINGVDLELIRKNIKHIHLRVHPPNGRVSLAVPLHTSEEEIRLLTISRKIWIQKEQEAYKNQDRQTERKYDSGESVYMWGRQYRLRIINSNISNDVKIEGDRLILQVRKESTIQQRENVLNEWYRAQLKEKIPDLIKKWEPIIGVHVNEWGVKNMKTKWGTCNSEAGRIWLNLQLAKKPSEGLEYIVVHEKVHLLEKRHNKIFLEYMDKFMPFWKERKDDLNASLLEYMDA